MAAAVPLAAQGGAWEDVEKADAADSDNSETSTAAADSESSEDEAAVECMSSAPFAQGRGASRIRTCLCWSAFAFGFVVELGIHATYGISTRTFEAEEDCKLRRGDLPFRCNLFVFCEIICRISLTVVLCAMVWEFGAAAYSRATSLCIRRTFAAAGEGGVPLSWPTQAAIMAFSLFIMVMGIWCALSEETLPFWGVVVCHVCDVFCHGIILSALVGVACDLVAALRLRSMRDFCAQLLLCFDTIEAHGVTGGDGAAAGASSSDEGSEEVELIAKLADSDDDGGVAHKLAGPEPAAAGGCRRCGVPCRMGVGFGHPNLLQFQKHRSHRPFVQGLRAAFVWTLFLLTLCAAVMDSYFADITPPWVGTVTKFEGCFCWSGIAWWVAQSAAELRHRLAASAGARPIAARETRAA